MRAARLMHHGDDLRLWEEDPVRIAQRHLLVHELLARDDHSLGDRKSTRLNSSHGYISYAVFCLKKKKRRTRSDGNDFAPPHQLASQAVHNLRQNKLDLLPLPPRVVAHISGQGHVTARTLPQLLD